MEVLFAGICLWERKSRTPALLGLMPNGRTGMDHGSHQIPPHTAGVMVKQGEVNASQWPQPPQVIAVQGEPHLLFEFDGEDISFDPPPNGGASVNGQLPPLGCADGKVIHPGLTGSAPSKSMVLARIDLPPDVRMNVVTNRFGAKVTRIVMDDATQLVSKPFGGKKERRLKFTVDNPTVAVVNIDLASALAVNPNPDDEHAHLYCPMFIDENAPPAAIEIAEEPRQERRADAVLAGLGARLADQLTIGPGCSNSQWP